jgi:MFS family permease
VAEALQHPIAIASPIRGRYRGKVVLLLCLMYAISYVDRTNIATAAPTIQSDLHLSSTQLGLVLGAFSIPYALFQVFGGTIGERFGPRRALTWIGILWGVATIATGFSVGFWSLFGARLLLGLTESAAFPTATQAMTRWVPRDRNGFVQGVVHSASRLGNAVAPLVVAALIAFSGWRSSFFYIGILSVLWAVLWVSMFRNRPDQIAKVTQQELSEMPVRPAAEKLPPVPWKTLIPAMLPVMFVDFGYGWTLWVFLTWLPSFLSSNFHLNLGGYALFSSIVLLGGVFGDTVGGVFSDRIFRRTGNLRNARRAALMTGLIGSLVCLTPLLFAPGLLVATISLALSFFFLELTNAPLWAIPMDMAPTWAGSASGLMNTGFGIAGVFSPIVFGILVQYSGWQWPFALSIALLAAAAVVAGIMRPKSIPAPKQPELEQPELA